MLHRVRRELSLDVLDTMCPILFLVDFDMIEVVCYWCSGGKNLRTIVSEKQCSALSFYAYRDMT